MKIIFLENVKGKGNRFEVKDIASGYANFLVKNKKALVATPENLSVVKKIQQRELDEANDILQAAMETEESIADKVYTFKRKVLPDGSTQRAVTKKDIFELVHKDFPIIDSVKQLDTDQIKTFGKHDVFIKLHPQITARIFVEVIAE